MKARTVKATFEIREDYDNAGVVFKIGNKVVGWEDLTYNEKVTMLESWMKTYQSFIWDTSVYRNVFMELYAHVDDFPKDIKPNGEPFCK